MHFPFLFNSEVYFRYISVNVGRAKTARRFVDRLLWHTREIRSVLLHQARGMSGGSKNIKQAFLFFWKNYFISISVNVGIFNSVLYIDTCNFVMGWNRETSFVTRPDPCQGVKKMCVRLRRTLTGLGIAILLWQSSYWLSAQRIANGK